MAFCLAVPAIQSHDFGMQLAKVSLVIYHLLKLAGIGRIAIFAVLIYQRMPLTYREYSGTEGDEAKRKTLLTERLPMVSVAGTVDVNIDNDPLNVHVEDDPLNVHVDDDPLPVTIER